VGASQPVVYEVHEGPEGLEAIGSAWRALEDVGCDLVFQTYEHAELWQRTVGTPLGARPLVVALREGDRVVGIFPACRVRESGMPLLTWLGAPRVLEYGDVLFDPAAATSIDEFVRRSLDLLSRRARGSLLYLVNVREDARAFEPLCARLRVVRETAAPYIPISGTWSDYRASLRHKMRGNLSRHGRRLEAMGSVEFRRLDPGDPGIPVAMARLAALQRARFKMVANRTPLTQRHYQEFRTEQALGEHARVWTLSLNGTCIAVGLSLVYRGRLSDLLGGFDSDYARCAPGFLMQAFVVRSCFENGWDPCDLGWGDEGHKYNWTDSDAKLTSFVDRGIGGGVLAALMRLRQWLKGRIDVLRRGRDRPSRSATAD
jgi:CelD/BcsL family acetyltransferase involved in cellulose biosynthesis